MPLPPSSANTVQIVNRTTRSRIGIVSNEGGISIATSAVLTTRHLDIDETSDEPSFYVGFEFETNDVTTAETPQDLDAEISVSETGALHEVRIGDSVFSAESLASIDRSVIVPRELSRGICTQANQLEFEEAPAETPENESDADLEEADAG